VAISNVVISIPLIYVWGVIGAAVGTMISLVCGNILFMNWYYQKKLNLDIVRFWKSLLSFIPAIVLVIIYGVIYCYFIEITGWLLLAISIITYSGVYFAVMWLFGFNSSEKRLMISLINRKLQR
jgi:O-antigen/teichoic acid export membrane protein